MQQFSRVLAAVDFSRPARGAFEYALALSQRHGAELVSVQAVPANEALSWHARERFALTAKLRRRADLANVPFTERVRPGDPAKIIRSHTESLRADVVVLGTHQRTGLDRLTNGSVAERVAGESSVPVLVVPYRRRTVAVKRFSHVAVAIDLGAGALRVVEQALALANAPGDRITLLHVVPSLPSLVRPELYPYVVATSQAELIRNAYRRLQRSVPVRRLTPAAIHVRVLVGDTTSEVGRDIDTIGADLLVVGVPKRGAVARTLRGSTAARLLRVSRVPVLAVPEAGTVSSGHGTTVPELAA